MIPTPPDLNPHDASRTIHRLLIHLVIYLNRGLESCEAWRDLGKEPSCAQFRTLMMLREIGPCTLKALAEALGISPASASEMIERLVESGFVQRRPDPHDRRCVQVALTPRAIDGVERHETLIVEKLQRLMEALGPRTMRMWVELAERLPAAMGEAALAAMETAQKGRC
jgi:DNA-binding MarR family transcriptional regulator